MDHLLTIERRIWQDRQRAFNSYYRPSNRAKNLTPSESYQDGLEWGILATFDNVLSIFREVLDGTPGSGHEQMAAQRARCTDPSEDTP